MGVRREARELSHGLVRDARGFAAHPRPSARRIGGRVGTKLGSWTLALDGTSVPERALIGGKAWSVARLRALGLPVPPAVVITTDACSAYLANGSLPEGFDAELRTAIAWLEQETGRTFGGAKSPLLVSVRSGAAVSMPGMMDTVLNLGINPDTAQALAAESGDTRFAIDTEKRFLDLYARIVLKATLPELGAEATVAEWQAAIVEATGGPVPDDPHAQLEAAVRAVFESWNSRRARRYRQHHGIPEDLGTAVTLQAMVFGNLDATSGTGVLFSRNPLTGEPAPYGEYLPRAQGEDVVSGRFTPLSLAALHEALPHVHGELLAAAAKLERENADVQDIEFTVQHGRLYLLQTRAAKRGPAAAVRFAVDMVNEGAIDEATALARVSAEQVRILLSPRLADGAGEAAEVLASGEAACQGIGSGVVVCDADEADNRAAAGERVVLACETTSPEDVHGMIAARAVITEHGGATSHAAVVSRALGVPCVVGCGSGQVSALAGREVTVDGGAGKIYAGLLPVYAPDEDVDPRLHALAAWAEKLAPLVVVAEPPAGLEVCDLDGMPGAEDPNELPKLLAGKAAARGGALASDEGVRAALAAGVKTLVVKPRLPALLAAVHAGSPQEH
ncbi:MAG: pyruvate, phosphate dikinase [Gammaproteobacteria bacterium]|nr:pyruvate, phosphate dikinase [Gammaproteobacteria bacterium]